MVSFSLALKQQVNLNLLELFEKLELDAFDKVFFSIPLFSGSMDEQGNNKEGRVVGKRKGVKERSCVINFFFLWLRSQNYLRE